MIYTCTSWLYCTSIIKIPKKNEALTEDIFNFFLIQTRGFNLTISFTNNSVVIKHTDKLENN